MHYFRDKAGDRGGDIVGEKVVWVWFFVPVYSQMTG